MTARPLLGWPAGEDPLSSGCFFDPSAADALGAHVLFAAPSALLYAYLLEIGPPDPFGLSVRVAHVVPNNRLLAANRTDSCHGICPFFLSRDLPLFPLLSNREGRGNACRGRAPGAAGSWAVPPLRIQIILDVAGIVHRIEPLSHLPCLPWGFQNATAGSSLVRLVTSPMRYTCSPAFSRQATAFGISSSPTKRTMPIP